MGTRDYQTFVIHSAAATTGIGEVIDVRNYDTVMLGFATDGGGDAALTAKIQGSIGIASPAFGSAAAADNIWSYVESIDIDTGGLVDGNVGFVVASADDVVIYEVNTNGLSFLTVNVTARTEGELTVTAGLFG